MKITRVELPPEEEEPPTLFHNDEEFCTKGCGRPNAYNPLNLERRLCELLLMLIQKYGGEADHPTMKLTGADYATIARLDYWGFTEQVPGARKGTRRVTEKGYLFAAGVILAPRTLYQFAREIRGEAGPYVDIEECLGKAYQTYEEIIETIRQQKAAARRAFRS